MKPLLDPVVKAMFEAKMFRGIDFIFGLIFACGALGLANWLVFGHYEPMVLILWLIGNVMVLVIWLILLVFRVAYLVLLARSEINLMPEAAARMALAHQQGIPVKR